METTYRAATRCRLCGEQDLAPVLSLGELALTGVFPKTLDEDVPAGPVNLVKCASPTGCGLVQLQHSYNLGLMYGGNYGYRSGLNESMVEHLSREVKKILAMNILRAGDVVVDIGSNDATTLRCFPRDGFKLIGIDPTGIKFKSFYPPWVTLVPDFFSSTKLKDLIGDQKVKVFTSFSMFYDLEDPLLFARQISDCLDENGVWLLEQSYLPAMINANSFDTICHEHLEYYGLRQIDWICKNSGLSIIDVEFNVVNGGSFSVKVVKKGSPLSINLSKVQQLLFEEEAAGTGDLRALAEFKSRIDVARKELISFLESAKNAGKSVYALGASTKGNVLLQYFGIDRNLIAGIGEVNPDKVGSFTPGSLIPILSEDEVMERKPDFILILPWHFRDFFLAKSKFRGASLVFPLPRFEIVDL
jgi:NDP-4-keto-2,6-dideoxyhexose 3-C-methyltransferase